MTNQMVSLTEDYKNFDNTRFSEELMSEIQKLGPLNRSKSIFHYVSIEVLEKYAPEKRKYIKSCYYTALKVT